MNSVGRRVLPASLDVNDRSPQDVRVFLEQTDAQVAGPAQKSTDNAGGVVVVDGEAARQRALADRADSCLCLVHGLYVGPADAELLQPLRTRMQTRLFPVARHVRRLLGSRGFRHRL